MDLLNGYARGYNLGVVSIDNISRSNHAFTITLLSSFGTFVIAQEETSRQYYKTALAIGTVTTLIFAYKHYNSVIEQRNNQSFIDPILNNVPKILVVVNFAFMFLTAREKPHRALAAGIAGAVSMSDAYNYLPRRVSQVWSYTPDLRNCIVLFAGSSIEQLTSAYVLYQRIAPYFKRERE